MPRSNSAVHEYHDGTKHHFNRFARSLGYLDWASQPAPFRSYAGARLISLHPAPDAPRAAPGSIPDVSYEQLFAGGVAAAPLSAAALGDLLRHSLGLSAWKAVGAVRWSLRVNPSSGNLHPTEAYVVCGPIAGVSSRAGVYHYAPDRHVLEKRCTFDPDAWIAAAGTPDVAIVALTSIHWREAWKYGERAFRYCQHDAGHAIGALSLAAAALGWEAQLLPEWSHVDVAALCGADRDSDFVEAEREEPACTLAIGPGVRHRADIDVAALVAAVRGGEWHGRPSQLSEDHVDWTFIEQVAEVTRWPGGTGGAGRSGESGGAGGTGALPNPSNRPDPLNRPDPSSRPDLPDPPAPVSARSLFIQRRSAVAFDAITRLPAAAFFRILQRVLPGSTPPWTSIWWDPCVHLVLFVHRVDDVPPGLYLLGRDRDGAARLIGAMKRDFTHETVRGDLPLVRLASGDCRSLARRLSCDQEIAADGCFAVAMVAEFDGPLARRGAPFYRQLFWETGVIGQVLYLEAEAARIRATGIGCFYDDPVHDLLGLEGHAFQSLYHFTMGGPVDDSRITAEAGYGWG